MDSKPTKQTMSNKLFFGSLILGVTAIMFGSWWGAMNGWCQYDCTRDWVVAAAYLMMGFILLILPIITKKLKYTWLKTTLKVCMWSVLIIYPLIIAIASII